MISSASLLIKSIIPMLHVNVYNCASAPNHQPHESKRRANISLYSYNDLCIIKGAGHGYPDVKNNGAGETPEIKTLLCEGSFIAQ